MSFFKSIKNFFQEKSRINACAKHFFYDDLLTKEINYINKKENLLEDDIKFYKKVGQYCISKYLSLEKDNDIIEAIAVNSFNVPIAGIYYLDGWFQSARYDKDRFESDYISIHPRHANKIMHTRDIVKGDYIIVIEEDSLELKKEIRDFDGRILRDAINTNSHFARLIKITDDCMESNYKIQMDYCKRANDFAMKHMPPLMIDRIKAEDVEHYMNLRDGYIEQLGDIDRYKSYDVKGKVIEKKYLRTIASLSYINSRLLQQEQIFNIGDVAYTNTNREVKVLEKTTKGYLVEDKHSGLIGEETKLYDAISAYFIEYFSGREKSCTLKWKKDKELLNRGVNATI